MKKNRIYADTSVFGGVFDPEFALISSQFFEEVRKGHHLLLISEITGQELENAPLRVRELILDLPQGAIEKLVFSDEMADLRDAYLSAKVIERKWNDDAGHVAAATVSRADAIISWNFKHMVKLEKIRAFNSVNIALGYPMIAILSPREVIADEKDI
jgi:hypothetical protein